MNEQYTNELVDFILEFKKTKLKQEDIYQVKRAVLDFYCAAITGSQTDVSRRLYNYLTMQDGCEKVNVVGFEKKMSMENAAFLYGTSAHSLDFDDGHSGGSFHPGSVVIPAVISVSEELDSNSENIFKAIIIGYEIGIRISSTIHPSSRKSGFHNTPIAGIFGAVGAVSFLMNMDRTEILMAMGVAGSFASGLFAFLGSGSEIKRIHPGKAAKDAIIAANLVKHEISGPTDILENENGFFKAFAKNNINKENLLQGLGERFLIHDIYFKPYPCCRHLHSGIDAVYQLKEKNLIDISKIRKIKVGVNEIAYLHKHKNCNTLLDAQMSLPHAIASAFYYEQINIESFIPERIPDQIFQLSEIISIYVDKHAENQYPDKRISKVIVELEDGTEFIEQVDIPLGEPSNPLNDQQLRAKFINNCKGIIGESNAKQFIQNIDKWDLKSQNQFLYNIRIVD